MPIVRLSLILRETKLLFCLPSVQGRKSRISMSEKATSPFLKMFLHNCSHHNGSKTYNNKVSFKDLKLIQALNSRHARTRLNGIRSLRAKVTFFQVRSLRSLNIVVRSLHIIIRSLFVLYLNLVWSCHKR